MTDPDIPGPDDTLRRWLDALAAPSAVAAGGSAAGVTGALAASLVAMVAGLTTGRVRYSGVEAQASQARSRAIALRGELLGLAARDGAAFAAFVQALALPRGSESEQAAREAAKRDALREAARVQLGVLELAAETAELALEMAKSGLASAMGDAATGVFLAAAAARSAYWSIRWDLEPGEEPGRQPSPNGVRLLMERAEAAERRVSELLGERLG